MDTTDTSQNSVQVQPLVDIDGLRASGIFPAAKTPSTRTIRRWMKARLIPYVAPSPGFILFDVAAVRTHLLAKATIKPLRQAA